MAENQILTGGNSFSTPSAGIGAVVINDDQAQKNEDDAIAATNDYIAKKQQAQQAAKANTNKIMAGLDLSTDGVRPQDLDGDSGLKSKAQKIMQNAATLYGAFNGDLTSQAAQQAWMKNVAQPQVQFSADVQKSKGVSVNQLTAAKELNDHPYNYDQEAAGGDIAHLAATHLDQIGNNLGQISPNIILKSRPKDFDETINAWILNTNGKKGVPNADSEPPPGGGDKGLSYIHNFSTNISKKQIDALANSYRSQPAINAAVQKDWADLKNDTPGVVNSLMAKYIKPVAEGGEGLSPSQAEQKAQRDWVKNRITDSIYHQTDDRYSSKPTEKSKLDLVYARNANAAQNNTWTHPLAQITHALSGDEAAANSFIGTPQKTYNRAVLNPDGTQKLDDKTGAPLYTKDIPNSIESVDLLPNGGVRINTTETNDKMSQANFPYYINSLDPNTGLPKMNTVPMPTGHVYTKNQALQMANFIYHDPNKIQKIGNAAKIHHVINDDGDVDTESYNQKYSGQTSVKAIPKGTPQKAPAKSFTPEQEVNIKKNIDANPLYSREEVIKALGY